MNVNKAFMVVRDNLGVATELLLRMETRGATSAVEASLLVRTLQLAQAAAMELQARAAGTPEPKRGD